MKEKIYLIPGLMTDHRLWHKLEPHLDEYELIHTPIPLSDDFDEIVDFLHENFEDEKINLLGFSLGGYIASYYSIKYPTKVQRLFLVGSTPSATEIQDIPRRKKRLEDTKNNKFVPLSIEKAEELLEKPEDKLIANTMVDMFNDLGHETFISQLSSTLNRVDLFDKLSNLDVPINLFYSSKDRLLNHNSIKSMTKKVHDIKLTSREGTSHNIPLEIPVDLSSEIKEWMVS